MRRVTFAALLFLASTGLLLSVAAQPPGGGDEKKEKKAKTDKKGKGPPKFTPGQLFPPGLREELKLTAEQEKAIAAIEKELKEKLDKLLTAEQKKTLEEFRPGPPMGPPEGAPMPKEKKGYAPQAKLDAGIQWFATLDAGLAEAKRTGKPILYLSAAPHCGGVPGMW